MSKCVRLHTNNYLDLEILANSDASSAQTAFPVVNAYNRNRRSKVWRSNGYWKVTSSNNGIEFRENSGGPNLLASIATGEYSSVSTFLTAVKNALDAAGAATYTVTQDGDFKIVLTSNLGGGATVFQPRFAQAASTAANILGFDTVDLSGASTYTADVLRINGGEEWILWDFGLPTNPDSFFLIGARNRALKISPSATILLQGNETNSFTTPSFSMPLTYDASVIAAVSDNGFHTEPLRYWRVKFVDQNPFGYIEIGAMSLGNYWAPERGGAQFPLEVQLIDRTETVLSEGGQTFSDIKENTAGFGLEWRAFTKQDKEDLEQIFEEVGTGLPFFLTLDSMQGYSTSLSKAVRYVKFKSAPKFSLVSPNNYSVTTDFEEQL